MEQVDGVDGVSLIEEHNRVNIIMEWGSEAGSSRNPPISPDSRYNKRRLCWLEHGMEFLRFAIQAAAQAHRPVMKIETEIAELPQNCCKWSFNGRGRHSGGVRSRRATLPYLKICILLVSRELK